MARGGERAQSRRRAQDLKWERNKALIDRYYNQEGKPLREVCAIMKDFHCFDATERMYKTRFNAWGWKKYRIDGITKLVNREAKRRLAREDEPQIFKDWKEGTTNGKQDCLQDDQHNSLRGSKAQARPGFSLHRPFATGPFSATSDDLSLQNATNGSIIDTPDPSQPTTRPSSSDRGSAMTPASSQMDQEQLIISQRISSGSESALIHPQSSPEEGFLDELHAPRPVRTVQVPRSSPQDRGDDLEGNDTALAGQLVDRTMSFSWPSTFDTSSPSDSFRCLMTAPINGSIAYSDSLREILSKLGGTATDQIPDLTSPQPETWTFLCLYINVLFGKGHDSEAKVAMRQAAMIYQMLVLEENDQILSILTLVNTILFLHGKGDLGAELLQHAHIAAACYLKSDDPILISIEFMIAMALEKSRSCGIRIRTLRQVAEKMAAKWGEGHRYSVTANYNLAWRLAQESDLRVESLGILRRNQVIAEQVFEPQHIQTIAFINTQARVLGHLGFHLEAEQTMYEALQRIEMTTKYEDDPFYLEAKRRYEIFVKERDRVRNR